MNMDKVEIPKLIFNTNGDLIITGSPTSSNHDFDFFVGKWRLQNKKLKTRLSNSDEWEEFESTQEMYKVLNGIGNVDKALP